MEGSIFYSGGNGMKNFGKKRRFLQGRTRFLHPGLLLLLISISIIPGAVRATSSPQGFHAKVSERSAAELARRDFMSVCPPFFLRDEQGRIIDPVHGVNVQQPYSPKRTCGLCHDYQRITSGYHFQQGKDEKLSPKLAALYPWMRTPGQYGGRY